MKLKTLDERINTLSDTYLEHFFEVLNRLKCGDLWCMDCPLNPPGGCLIARLESELYRRDTEKFFNKEVKSNGS